MKKLIFALLFGCIAGSAFAQTSFTAKDAGGSTQTFKSFNCTSNICSLSVPADSTGAAFGVTGNPFFITGNGVAGTANAGVVTVQGIAAMTPLSIQSADATQSISITSSTTSTALALVGTNSVQFNLTGTWVAIVVGQISNDNTNWVSVPLLNMSVAPPAYIVAATGATTNGNYLLVGTQGARYARVSVTYTSGTVAGAMTATSQGPSVTFGDYVNYLQIISSIPAGSNTIGNVNAYQGSAALSVTNGLYSNLLQGNVVLSATNGLYNNLLQGNVALGVTNPIFSGISDGTNLAAVKAASTPSPATDKSLSVTINAGSNGIVTLGPAADSAAVPMVQTPTSSSTSGITPVVGGSAVSSLVLKASAGNLYSVYANCTSSCWLMVFNATSAPSNGATTAGVASGNLVECIPIGAGSVGGVNYQPGAPAVYTVGMTATISSTACSTLTLSTVGFIHGLVK